MFAPNCRCLVVVGAQWGDEGKGKVVDVLAEGADIVVRYQGGANAGHTVVRGQDEFILHEIPSGILHAGTRCVVGNGVVLNPETFLGEIEALERRGVDLQGRLAVSDRAHLVLPLHRELDRVLGGAIGTTGRGIGPAYEDKVGRRGIRVGDLRNLDRARAIVRDRVARVHEQLQLLHVEARVDADEHERLLQRVAPRLVALATDTGRLVSEALVRGEHVLLEGAQGALLDLDHGTYPYVTSSNTTAGGAAVGSGIGPTAIEGVLGVAKAYTTRVGNGPLPTQADAEAEGRLRDLGGEYGATTGRPRRCGWFDAAIVRYSARVNGLTALAVTKLDVLDTLPTIPLCTGYRLRGDPVDTVPSDSDMLELVEPVYEELEGWCRPTAGARSMSDLPAPARAYLDRLAALAGVPIRYVSVGNRRDQIITVV